MTPDEFRSLALSLPEAEESAHMDHPDFRVGGKIFASLGPKQDWAMTKLTPEQQAVFLRDASRAFKPSAGAWGKRGYTEVTLALAETASVRQALILAWRNTAPRRMQHLLDDV